MTRDQELKLTDPSAGEDDTQMESAKSVAAVEESSADPSGLVAKMSDIDCKYKREMNGNADRGDESATFSDVIAELAERLAESHKHNPNGLCTPKEHKQIETDDESSQPNPRIQSGLQKRQRSSTTNSIGPLFILAPPRSFTSVVGAMIGQHPQTYGLPELELFAAETIGEWWELCSKATFPRAHGSLRAVAELFFGEQTPETVKLARGWLRRRSHITTGYFLELLANQVRPRIPVEKSTSNVYERKFMHRTVFMFPNARFIHLVRHPRGQGESVIKFLSEREKQGPVRANHWMRRLARYETAVPVAPEYNYEADEQSIDPQRAWLALHRNICDFLESIPEDQKLRVRGEDVLTDPDRELRKIAAWLGVSTDAEAINQMKHPERSVYACFGPPGARYGNDRLFLEDPKLRPGRAEPLSLEGSLAWRSDGLGFSPEVKRLALEFGYE